MSLCPWQQLPLTGSVIVRTPQSRSGRRPTSGPDTQQLMSMFWDTENMSWFEADDGKTYDLFGKGMREHGVRHEPAFFAAVLMHMDMRTDTTTDTAKNFDINENITKCSTMCESLAQQVSITAMSDDLAADHLRPVEPISRASAP